MRPDVAEVVDRIHLRMKLVKPREQIKQHLETPDEHDEGRLGEMLAEFERVPRTWEGELARFVGLIWTRQIEKVADIPAEFQKDARAQLVQMWEGR